MFSHTVGFEYEILISSGALWSETNMPVVAFSAPFVARSLYPIVNEYMASGKLSITAVYLSLFSLSCVQLSRFLNNDCKYSAFLYNVLPFISLPADSSS